jgi:hypothetical protein
MHQLKGKEFDMENKIGYIKKDQQEKYTLKRGWFVNAWRVVDSNGKDYFQPWCSTRREALTTARELEITIVGQVNN